MSGDGRGTPVEASAAIWDEHARWWAATFTEGADVEYARQIIPLIASELGACRLVLDVGCGEGQVARALAAEGRGPAVIGIDPSSHQLAAAVAHGGEVAAYVEGAAEALPFAAGTFDGVLCCLAIEHCADVDAVLEEVARVLAPGGTFLLLVNHPMFQGTGSGFVDDQILGERYWRVGPYLDEVVTEEVVDRGVRLPFAHRPLSRYLNPLAARDVVCTAMHEPRPLPEFLEDSVDPVLEGSIPRLLVLRFERWARPMITASGQTP